jgi:NAD-dependent SIR2 family protein deacetylase
MTEFQALQDFIDAHDSLFILTGAGCSTGSGIPDYRDADGQWKRAQPMTYQAFMSEEEARRRYWARSFIGWPRFEAARPNGSHRALARLEGLGKCKRMLTQNVDRLHQAAGSANVIDLHGRLDQVRCMNCDQRYPRGEFQADLVRLNPNWQAINGAPAPDGDADLDGADFSTFAILPCARCAGILKPDVVFFGESVPRDRVQDAMACLEASDAMLVVGSSLMVYSGFRFVDFAAQAGKPIAAINLGRTRADPVLTLKIEAECQAALSFLL